MQLIKPYIKMELLNCEPPIFVNFNELLKFTLLVNKTQAFLP